jgi:hypothetical protein
VSIKATRQSSDFGGNVLLGDLRSKTALKPVREWIDLRDSELWLAGKPLEKVPLEYNSRMWRMNNIRSARYDRHKATQAASAPDAEADELVSPQVAELAESHFVQRGSQWQSAQDVRLEVGERVFVKALSGAYQQIGCADAFGKKLRVFAELKKEEEKQNEIQT